MTNRDQVWLAMMLERLRQHAFNAGVFHSDGHTIREDSESAKADEARSEILAVYT